MENKDIKGLRLEFGLSQEGFARLLGVSLQTVRRWENGQTKPLPIIEGKLEELRDQARADQRKQGGVSMDAKKTGHVTGVDFNMGGLFKGLGGLFDLVSKMTEQGVEEHAQSGEISGLEGKLKGVYGFSVKTGLGGKPIIEQFGNIQSTEEGALVTDINEPLVDVLDEGDHLMVIAEIPGVEEKNIHIEINGDILDLTAEARDRKYIKEVLLPFAVEAGTLQSSYRNGILEIRLMKKQPEASTDGKE
ncbi:MAG: helix-turn-helix domain-containing protein [Chloroflexi bacterium]|nr:helix-turn-helix domain-containing protein [Chloroflexota bacterium]